MFYLSMNDKGFEADTINTTPNHDVADEKPLKDKDNQKKTVTVDINVLKARAQQIEDSENKKNIFIFIFFVAILGVTGIYLSI